MGGSSFDYGQYTTYTKSKTTATRDELFTSSQLHDEVNPAKIKNGYREACDSTDNPNSTPVIISLDATGSMGFIPEYMVRTGLGELFKNIYDLLILMIVFNLVYIYSKIIISVSSSILNCSFTFCFARFIKVIASSNVPFS